VDDTPTREVGFGEVSRKHRMAAHHTALGWAAPRTEAYVDRGCSMLGGALLTWYDGARLVEQGYTVPPLITIIWDDAGIGAPHPKMTLSYNAIWTTHDDRGCLHRSMPGTEIPEVIDIDKLVHLYVRSNPATMRGHAQPYDSAQIYRSDENAIMRRILTPAAQVPNTRAQLEHGIGGAALCTLVTDRFREPVGSGMPLYTEGGVIEAAPIEGCTIVHVALERCWAAGAFRQGTLYYSKRFVAAGTINAPEFSEAFTLVVPDGAAITGIGSIADRLIVLTETAVYALAGLGPTDDGQQNDFSALTPISTMVGCVSPVSVVTTPDGVFFRSRDSIMLVTPAMQVVDVGLAVRERTALYPVTAAAAWWPEREAVVFAVHNDARDAGELLVLHARHKQWARWRIARGLPVDTYVVPVALAVHQGELNVAHRSGGIIHVSDPTLWSDGNDKTTAARHVPLSVSTGWHQAGGGAAWQLCRLATVFAKREGVHGLTVSVYTDFASSPTTTAAFSSTDIGTDEDETLQVKPAVQKCQAIRVKVEDTYATAYTASFTLVAVALDVAQIGASARTPAAKR
jgi:hypothetical protein